MKPSFFERVGAYLIDLIIITILAIIIGTGLPARERVAEKELSELTEQYIAGEITGSEYLDDYSRLLYQNQKDSMLETGIGLALTVAYFIVFQYLNSGQTLGKKLLHLRVVDNETKEKTSVLKGLVRSIIVFGIASSSLNLILLNIVSKHTYMISYLSIGAIEFLFTLLTIIFVLYRKDGRGLHDLMANTIVIKEGR